ncbi:MAG: hypothetical protein Tsb0020_55760 [Haliangiales bacterium]
MGQIGQSADGKLTAEPSPELEAVVTPKAEPSYELQVLVDPQARWADQRGFREVAVGHTWVRLVAPTGQSNSWGYWPGEELAVTAPHESVRGEVKSPDGEQVMLSARAADVNTHRYEIAEEAAARVAYTANAQAQAPGSYNLFDHNCVDFVRELAAEAGVDVPDGVFRGVLDAGAIEAAVCAGEAGVVGGASHANADADADAE